MFSATQNNSNLARPERWPMTNAALRQQTFTQDQGLCTNADTEISGFTVRRPYYRRARLRRGMVYAPIGGHRWAWVDAPASGRRWGWLD